MTLTRQQKLKILQVRLQKELEEYRRSRDEAVARGAKGVTYSTGDGSKSATFYELKDLERLIEEKSDQLASVTRAIAHRPFFTIGHVMTTRSC